MFVHIILTLTSATQRSHWHSKHLERHSKRRRSSVGNKSLTTRPRRALDDQVILKVQDFGSKGDDWHVSDGGFQFSF